MLVFVIPVYNESFNLGVLIERIALKASLMGLNYRLIMVNDGSIDDTAERIKCFIHSQPLDLISYYPNKGPGEAFRVGLKRALEICRDSDIIVTQEADNTSDLDILGLMLAKINDGYDLVLASCYAKGGSVLGTTYWRILLSRSANMLLKVFFPIKGVHTYTSFYRAYRAGSMKELKRIYGENLIRQKGFESMAEILVKFSRNKAFRISEVPMVLDITRRRGKSKMRIMKTTAAFLKVILKAAIIYRLNQIFNKNGKR